MDNKVFIEKKFKEFKEKHNLSVSLCFELPQEFLGAFGMFDVTKDVIYINNDEKISYVRLIFTFFHELRHAMQYNSPEKFSKEIQQTLPYVVHFDGNCYMLKNNKWQHCYIENENNDFLEIYKSFPYEIDANDFAYKQALAYIKDSEKEELERIYKQTLPTQKIEIGDVLKICEVIKSKCT